MLRTIIRASFVVKNPTKFRQVVARAKDHEQARGLGFGFLGGTHLITIFASVQFLGEIVSGLGQVLFSLKFDDLFFRVGLYAINFSWLFGAWTSGRPNPTL